MCPILFVFKRPARPVGVASQVEHSPHHNDIFFDCIVHGIGESFGEEPMTAKDLRVNSRIKHKRVNVGEEGIEKITAKTLGLLLI